MSNYNYCVNCQKPEDGICPFITAEDGLSLRCSGYWSRDKLYYVDRYMNIFNKAMKQIWKDRVFIDLFSGPGRCIIRKSEQFIDGSPILALKQNPSFTKCIFIDLNDETINCLLKRIKSLNFPIQIKTIHGDCNNVINNIRQEIPSNSLALTFIDPTSMQINFSSIKDLTSKIRMDLIINYPLQAINRAYQDALNGNDDRFNAFFGNSDWKQEISNLKGLHNVAAKLLPLYKRQLESLGYLHFNSLLDPNEILVKGPRDIPLYYLFFASKHPIAHKFWSEIKKKRPDNQLEMLFE